MKLLWIIIIALILFSVSVAIYKHYPSEKFNKTQWCYKNSMAEYPYRIEMLDDLLYNHKLIGLKYSEIINLIGIPSYTDSNELFYDIETKWGWNIDPVGSTSLGLNLSEDSIITNFKVYKYRK